MIYETRKEGLPGCLLKGLDGANPENDSQYLPDYDDFCERKRSEGGPEETVDAYGYR